MAPRSRFSVAAALGLAFSSGCDSKPERLPDQTPAVIVGVIRDLKPFEVPKKFQSRTPPKIVSRFILNVESARNANGYELAKSEIEFEGLRGDRGLVDQFHVGERVEIRTGGPFGEITAVRRLGSPDGGGRD